MTDSSRADSSRAGTGRTLAGRYRLDRHLAREGTEAAVDEIRGKHVAGRHAGDLEQSRHDVERVVGTRDE